jgi:large subunit ribosomal protein L7/L12
MSISAERPNVRVFLSYRRIDNPAQGAFPGQISAFRDDLENTIAREIGHRHVQVYMDTDPEKLIGDRSWSEKILKELRQTTVFVSIMTANYLDSESEHASAWEFREYRKVYEADPDHHSLITIQLCPPEVAADALSGPDWQALGSQEIIDYTKSRTAWRNGQGHATWNNLIGEVSDAIIAFARKAAAAKSAPAPQRASTPAVDLLASPISPPQKDEHSKAPVQPSSTDRSLREVLEAVVSRLNEAYDVPASPVSVESPNPPPVKAESKYDVVLESVGESKIQVIRVVRELTGLSLAPAKDMVESTPSVVLEGVNGPIALKAQNQLLDVGAIAWFTQSG